MFDLMLIIPAQAQQSGGQAKTQGAPPPHATPVITNITKIESCDHKYQKSSFLSFLFNLLCAHSLNIGNSHRARTRPERILVHSQLNLLLLLLLLLWILVHSQFNLLANRFLLHQLSLLTALLLLLLLLLLSWCVVNALFQHWLQP